MSVVHGHCDPRFADVAAALAEEVDSGAELGASIAVDIDGDLVVDIWAGHADAARTVEWSQNTIVNFWSCTKTLTALAALMVVDRGLLDPFAPVAQYWPEFAANGKHRVQVRHLLAHTSGVSGWDPPFTLEDIYDWEKSTAHLARQAPWWPPGSASGYHAVTYGHLVGELLRRVTGITLKDFVHREIAEPVHADVQIGARAGDEHRIAELVPPPPARTLRDARTGDHLRRRTFAAFPPDAASVAVAHSAAWRGADIGASNGHGNARSLVRALSPITRGGSVNGVRLLSQDTIDLIFQEQSNGIDLVLGAPVRFGIGFALTEGRGCFWGGWGGSLIAMHPRRRTTFAYVMNKMGDGTLGSRRTARYAQLVREAAR